MRICQAAQTTDAGRLNPTLAVGGWCDDSG